MPASAKEKPNRTGELGDSGSGSRGRTWQIFDAADELEALAILDEEAPATLDGLPRKLPIKVKEVDPTAQLWEGEVNYEQAAPTGGNDSQLPPDGTNSFSFEITGKQQKITNSKFTVARWSESGQDFAGDETPDFGGLINVSVKGDKVAVDGVEIVIPEFNFSETHIKTGLTLTYVNLIGDTVGKVNTLPFRGRESGSVLMTGASGNRKGLTKWEITFKFAYSENRDDIEVGDIGPIEKLGWEFLWVFPRNTEQDVTGYGKIQVSVPAFVYIEQVYDYADFTDLLLGTGVFPSA